jgi:hypothetical protein
MSASAEVALAIWLNINVLVVYLLHRRAVAEARL